MKNYYIFLRGTFYILFAFSVMFLFLVGCRSYNIEVEDVSNQEPYSKFIGAKYKLKRGCYLALSSLEKDFLSETNNDEFIKSYYKKTDIKPAISTGKAVSSLLSSEHYIVACRTNGSPFELNEKYIGEKIIGGTIVGILPQGSEFIIKKIVNVYLDGDVVFVNTYVELLSNGIIANAFLLVRGDPDTLVFEWRYVEMVDPEPEKK